MEHDGPIRAVGVAEDDARVEGIVFNVFAFGLGR